MTEATFDLLPVNGWIWVERDPAAVSISGLEIPERYRKSSELATIRYSSDPLYPVSARIIIGRISGEEIIVDGVSVWAVRPDEIRAFYEDGDQC